MTRRKPLTVAEARALLQKKDVESVQGWKGSVNEIVEAEVRCVVCGAPNLALVSRINMMEVKGAKYLCFDCQDFGWAWMGSLQSPEGTVTENKTISTVEEEAIKGKLGDYRKANDLLFKSSNKMKVDKQNPIAMYKPIRNYEDDVLLLRLEKCKHPRDIDEYQSWDLWFDKKGKP